MTVLGTGLASDKPMTFAVMNNKVWIANGHDPIKVFDYYNRLNDAIIVPPGSSFTAGASGSAVIAKAKYKVAFVDKYGKQSALGPASNADAWADIYADADGVRQNVALSSVPVSTDGQVAERYIYRKTEGGKYEEYSQTTWRWFQVIGGLTKIVFEGTVDEYASAGSPQGVASVRLRRSYLGKQSGRRFLPNPKLDSEYLYIGNIADNSTTTFTDDVSHAEAIGNAKYPEDVLSVVPSRPIIFAGKDRLWLWGQRSYGTSTGSATNGSAVFSDASADFQDYMEGLTIDVTDSGGAKRRYTISSVDSTTQVTFTAVYAGATEGTLTYVIHGEKSELLYTEANAPGEFLAHNGVNANADDGDTASAGMFLDNLVVLYKKRHIYTLEYFADVNAGEIRCRSNEAGCVNEMSVVNVNGFHYFMADDGIYQFDGYHAKKISEPIQDDFDLVDRSAAYKFHAVHNKKRNQILFFYVKSGDTWPQDAFVYYYLSGEWGTASFDIPITASTLCEDENGFMRVYLATRWSDGKGTVFAYDIGDSDGSSSASATRYGTVTSATNTTITDASATFGGAAQEGCVVKILSGTGVGQTRYISSATGTVITVSGAWETNPDSTSVYAVGPINMIYKSAEMDFEEPTRKKKGKYLEIKFKPVSLGEGDPVHYAFLKLYYDSSDTAFDEYQAKDEDGIYTTASGDEVRIDLSHSSGVVRIPLGDVYFYSVQARIEMIGVEDNVDIQSLLFDYDYADAN